MARPIATSSSGGKVQGASTLTMQLARNLFLSPTGSSIAKSRKLCWPSARTQVHQSQIFTLYANQIFLGHGAYGLRIRLEYYFNQPAK